MCVDVYVCVCVDVCMLREAQRCRSCLTVFLSWCKAFIRVHTSLGGRRAILYQVFQWRNERVCVFTVQLLDNQLYIEAG